MNKSQKTESKEGTIEARSPSPGKAPSQTKRYDAEFKKAAVENWIKTGKLGTQIAAAEDRAQRDGQDVGQIVIHRGGDARIGHFLQEGEQTGELCFRDVRRVQMRLHPLSCTHCKYKVHTKITKSSGFLAARQVCVSPSFRYPRRKLSPRISLVSPPRFRTRPS